MDKYEYKIKADEIKTLIAQGEYQQAAEIADGIDWRRVKSVMMLCTISDLYKINRRYEDSRDILLLAYDRHPGGRTIVYSLCELSIKIEDYVMAIEYYKEFVQIAPKDTGRYILQYKLYQAQDVSLEERIAVLEELKSKEYREKWAYELAYLYHRVGLATKCVEECDELVLWFGEGKYVVKAMELKMLHQPLTPEQQEKYDNRFRTEQAGEYQEQNAEDQGVQSEDQENAAWAETEAEQSVAEEAAAAVQPVDVLSAPTIRIPSEEIEIQVKTMDVGQYNTINLQKELAEGLREVLEEEQPQDETPQNIAASETDGIAAAPDAPQMETEVFFGATGEIGDNGQGDVFGQTGENPAEEKLYAEEVYTEEIPVVETETAAQEQVSEAIAEEEKEQGSQLNNTPLTPSVPAEDLAAENSAATDETRQKVVEADNAEAEPVDRTAAVVMEQLRIQNLGIEPPKEMAGVLSMESDGQISLVVPETEKVEKQITGQMSIQDILAEWERMKRENEEKRKEDIHQRVLKQTGPMFTAFEESIRDGLLEQLEQGVEPDEIIAEAENLSDDGEPIAADDEVEELTDIENSADDEVEELTDIEDSKEEDFSEEQTAEEEFTEEPVDGKSEEEVYGGETMDEPEEEIFEEETMDEEPEEESYGEETVEESEEEIYGGETMDESEEEIYGEETMDEEPEEETYGEEAMDESEEVTFGEVTMDEEPEEESYGEEAMDESEEETFEEETMYGEPEEETYGEEAMDESEEEIFEEETVEEPEEESNGEMAAEEPEEEKASESPVKEQNPSGGTPGQERSSRPGERPKVRPLTKEERELYGTFIQSKSSKEKLITAIDSISMAAYTGNVVITGDEGMDTLSLAKNMIREVQMTDSNFSGKIAKISGSSLNQRDVVQTLDGLANGALIIQKASEMSKNTVDTLYKALQHEKYGLIVIMEDTRKAMNKFLGVYTRLADCFNARVDMEALSNDALVAFGKKYAREMEYSIDELGVLALHTRISEMQTSDHAVTIMDVKEIMDEAIHHANRKTVGHFMDILLAKRYDEEDMIILKENDFI